MVNKSDKKDDDGESSKPDVDGVDDKCLHCFLEVGLQSGVLKTDLSDKDCIFLVNHINQENLRAIPYERFIDFIIPQSNKKVTTRLLRKIKRKELYGIRKPGYDIMCTFAKLLECEITIKRRV